MGGNESNEKSNLEMNRKFTIYSAPMAKLADELELGSNAARRAGSSPVTRAKMI